MRLVAHASLALLSSELLADALPLVSQVDDLTPRAEEAARLKDQMDEYRHASEKAKKQENVIDKYRKKLEEAGETRRMLKVRSPLTAAFPRRCTRSSC